MNSKLPPSDPLFPDLEDTLGATVRPEDFPAAALFTWMIRPRLPVWVSDDPLLRQIIIAIVRREVTEVFYAGGSTPGRVRKISPELVFQMTEDGSIYVSAYCHQRGQMRVFQFGRMLPGSIQN